MILGCVKLTVKASQHKMKPLLQENMENTSR